MPGLIIKVEDEEKVFGKRKSSEDNESFWTTGSLLELRKFLDKGNILHK